MEAGLAKYSIEAELRRGSFGCAMLARRGNNGEKVVIEQINLQPLSPKEQKEVEEEVALLPSLNHRNLVAFLESFIGIESASLKLLCIVVEYADGGDLAQLLASRSVPPPTAEVYDLFGQVLLAMKWSLAAS